MEDWSKIILKSSDTLESAIKVLHIGGLQIALVLDSKGKLLGTVTDGDIRRALINHLEMDSLVGEVMNINPATSLNSDSPDEIMLRMKNRNLLHMPILDKKGLLVGLETLKNLTYDKKYDNPVFLMAGGFGKRLQPLTEETPKPLLKVGGKPILETIISRFVKSGFHNFYISTFYKSQMIQEYFGDGSSWGINITYVEENKPLGTAGAIGLLPKDIPNLPILMMNGDVLTKVNFEHLLQFHLKLNAIATVCIREYDIQIPFGVVEIKDQKALNFVEKPVKKFFVNAGIYVFNQEMISKVKVDSYIDMPDLLEKQVAGGKNVNVFPIHEYWKDVGHIEEYNNVNDSFSNGFSLDD